MLTPVPTGRGGPEDFRPRRIRQEQVEQGGRRRRERKKPRGEYECATTLPYISTSLSQEMKEHCVKYCGLK